MIEINTALCNGCGACVEVCPTGALYLVEGKAMVEQKLCRDCESCIAACPTEAISLVSSKEAVVEPVRVPAPRPEPQVIQVKTKSAPAPLRASLLPIVGGALAWGWREIVPRLAEVSPIRSGPPGGQEADAGCPRRHAGQWLLSPWRRPGPPFASAPAPARGLDGRSHGTEKDDLHQILWWH